VLVRQRRGTQVLDGSATAIGCQRDRAAGRDAACPGIRRITSAFVVTTRPRATRPWASTPRTSSSWGDLRTPGPARACGRDSGTIADSATAVRVRAVGGGVGGGALRRASEYLHNLAGTWRRLRVRQVAGRRATSTLGSSAEPTGPWRDERGGTSSRRCWRHPSPPVYFASNETLNATACPRLSRRPHEMHERICAECWRRDGWPGRRPPGGFATGHLRAHINVPSQLVSHLAAPGSPPTETSCSLAVPGYSRQMRARRSLASASSSDIACSACSRRALSAVAPAPLQTLPTVDAALVGQGAARADGARRAKSELMGRGSYSPARALPLPRAHTPGSTSVETPAAIAVPARRLTQRGGCERARGRRRARRATSKSVTQPGVLAGNTQTPANDWAILPSRRSGLDPRCGRTRAPM